MSTMEAAHETTATAQAAAAAQAVAAPVSEGDNASTPAPPQVIEPPVVKTPLERMREVVDKNPLDFNSWVHLLSFVEADASAPIETVEETFDRFLAEFPLCFGYWTKYAQYEFALASKLNAEGAPVVDQATAAQRARAVYERGVVAVRHSVDMWVKYCEFLISTLQVPVDEARAALESAVAACGSDPMAGPLWEAYITLETLNNDMVRLNAVFKRIMHQPLSNVAEFWEKYNHFVLAQQLQTLATTDELSALAGEEEMDEGLLRVKVVNSVEVVKNRTLEGMFRRQAFEAGIDRSYFHVTPVSESALKNWHNYLDFEEQSGDSDRCEALYERCLIACANYEEFWLRYATWIERERGFDAANAVFTRAVSIFLKYRASIYLEYATFLEIHEKFDDARQVYERVLSDVAPTLVEAFLRRCNLERRAGQLDAAKQCYERALSSLTLQPDVFAHVVTSFATFLNKSVGDVAQARAAFDDGVKKTTSSVLLWLNYVHFELSVGGDDVVERVEAIYQNAVADASELSRDEKSDVWFQYVEFMETHASTAAAVRAVLANEAAWKRKHLLSRERSMKVLTFESSAQTTAAMAAGYSAYGGVKRPRYDAPVAAPVRAAPVPVAPVAAAPVAATATATPYAQYYHGYQSYGAQTYPAATAQPAMAAAAPVATAAAAAYPQAYTQAQYAAYYQQQQQVQR